MSKLFVINDFSPDSIALFAALSQHAPFLAQNNIEIAPFDSLLCESIYTHYSLFCKRPENSALPAHVSDMWAKVAEMLDSEKNVLLFTQHMELESHKYFWTHLQERINLERHKSEILIILGRPSTLLEQFCRYNSAARNSPFVQTYIDWIKDIPMIYPMIKEIMGEIHIETIANDSESVICSHNQQIFAQALAFLGCEAPPQINPNPFATAVKSHQSRRLFTSLEVRFNAWPRLDMKHMRELVLKLDEDLPEDWLAPLKLRQEFAQSEGPTVCALEALAGVAPGTLAASKDFVTVPDTDPEAPFSSNLARDFVNALTPSERTALKTRFSNDQNLLNDDQKIILAAIQEGEDFSSIGDAVPAPELTVLTMAYNHEKFIAECMESVLAQKTSFPVRHLVLDHCSEDGTAAIIAEYAKNYPSIQPVMVSKRIPCENVSGLFVRCHSKYVALCDGDDYFTEPTKLQKQVNMLEANSGLSLCFHPVAAVFEDGRPPVIFPPLSMLPKRTKMEFYLADLMNGNFIQTNSVVYRWRFRDGLPDWFRPDLCPGDLYWHMLHAEIGKIGFIPEVMSVYRRHANALYAKTFISSMELRRDHGMAELIAYHAYNEHFKNRYFRSISGLACGVFQDFLRIALGENDDRLFNEAMERFPEFGQAFLTYLKQQKQQMGTEQHIARLLKKCKGK